MDPVSKLKSCLSGASQKEWELSRWSIIKETPRLKDRKEAGALPT